MQMQPGPARATFSDAINTHLWWCATPPDEAAPRLRRARLDQLLREVLSRYVDVAPSALRFGRESRGKPFLHGTGMPDFNLSDTHGGSVIAVAHAPRVGVDLERLDRNLSHRRLARRYFSSAECGRLEAMSDEDARLAFLRLWTAKESSCKSTGTGIYGQLDLWSFDPREQAPTLVSLPDEARPESRWHHLRFEPAPGYTAVLTCDGWAPRVLGYVL